MLISSVKLVDIDVVFMFYGVWTQRRYKMDIRKIFATLLLALTLLLPTVAFAAGHHAPPPPRRTQVVRHVPRSAPHHMVRSHVNGGHRYAAPQRRYAPPPRRYAPPPPRYHYRPAPRYYYTPYYYGYRYYPRRYYSGWYHGRYYSMHREDWIALVGLAAFIAAFGG